MTPSTKELFAQEWDKLSIEPLYANADHYMPLVAMAEEYTEEVRTPDTDDWDLPREAARRAAYAFAVLVYGTEELHYIQERNRASN